MHIIILKYKGLMLSMGLRTELSFKKPRVTGMEAHFSQFSNDLIFLMCEG